MKPAPDDWTYTPTAAEQVSGLPMFRPLAPEMEQRKLEDIRFEHWLETADGQRAWDWIESEALLRAAHGEVRIGVKSLVEAARDRLHVTINNTATSLIARRLVDRHAVLRDRIELRERAA